LLQGKRTDNIYSPAFKLPTYLAQTALAILSWTVAIEHCPFRLSACHVSAFSPCRSATPTGQCSMRSLNVATLQYLDDASKHLQESSDTKHSEPTAKRQGCLTSLTRWTMERSISHTQLTRVMEYVCTDFITMQVTSGQTPTPLGLFTHPGISNSSFILMSDTRNHIVRLQTCIESRDVVADDLTLRDSIDRASYPP